VTTIGAIRQLTAFVARHPKVVAALAACNPFNQSKGLHDHLVYDTLGQRIKVPSP